MRASLVTLTMCILLAGCATPVPPQVAITDGVFSTPPIQSRLDRVLGGQDKTLLVVLSKNTKTNIDYLKGIQEARKKEIIGYKSIISAHIEALDPQFPSRWIVNQLKSKFGNLKIVPIESVSNQKGFDSMVIIDFFYSTTDWGVNHATASITTAFYDQNLAHISDAAVYKRVQVRSGAPVSDQDLFLKNHQVLISALDEWNTALDKLVFTPAKQ